MNAEQLTPYFDQVDNHAYRGAKFYSRTTDQFSVIFQDDGKQHIVEQMELRYGGDYSDQPGVLLIGSYGWKRWFADISTTDDLPVEVFVSLGKALSDAAHAIDYMESQRDSDEGKYL